MANEIHHLDVNNFGNLYYVLQNDLAQMWFHLSVCHYMFLYDTCISFLIFATDFDSPSFQGWKFNDVG